MAHCKCSVCPQYHATGTSDVKHRYACRRARMEFVVGSWQLKMRKSDNMTGRILIARRPAREATRRLTCSTRTSPTTDVHLKPLLTPLLVQPYCKGSVAADGSFWAQAARSSCFTAAASALSSRECYTPTQTGMTVQRMRAEVYD
jgi:hypothetical protein